MIQRLYLAFVIVVLGWVGVANYRGWSFWDSLSTGVWSPTGRSFGRVGGGWAHK